MVQTFTGKNALNLQTALKELVRATIESSGDFAVERFDASEVPFQTIFQSVQSLPFLSPSKLVIITNVQSCSELLERLEEFLSRVAEGVEVVLVDAQLDKRKSSYKQLQKLTKLTEFSELKSFELPSWVVEQARALGTTISKSDATYLVDRVGANQLQLMRELEKLSLYNPGITRQTIDLLTDEALQSTIFNLLDAAFSGDTKEAVRQYRDLRRNKIDPHYVIAMLVWQLFNVAQAVHAKPQTEQTVQAAGQSPYTAKKSLSVARHVTPTRLKQLVSELSMLDVQLKTSADADAGLELFLLSL